MNHREDYERGRRYRDERYDRDLERRARDWERRRYAGEEYDRDRRDYPGFLERLAEELRSWFRDDDADRRRGRDDRESGSRWGGGARGWGGDDDVDRDWARQWGYVEGRGRDSRLGRDRWTEAREPQQRGAGGEGFGSDRSAGDRYYEPRSGWGDPSAWGAERRGDDRGWRWSESSGGPHAGRGPRGYQRSDERIREDVCDRLCEHGYVDASQIEVTVLNGEVTLIGLVSDRQEKRMAEDSVESVSGVREVHNQLRVSPGGSGEESQGPSGDPRFRIA